MKKIRQTLITWVANPITAGVLSVVFILIGLIWFWLTVLPVVAVEARYQYKSSMQKIFGSTDWRAIILPNADWDLQGGSRHREYGIAIPSIFLDEPVVFNVDPNRPQEYQAALKEGIAHASSTAFPDNGGVGYYFAHSSSPEMRRQYNAIFYTLGKLKPGDDVYIWFENEKYRYQVTDSIITDDEDVSFLEANYDQETIILQTCWPPGTTAKRRLVFAERFNESANSE